MKSVKCKEGRITLKNFFLFAIPLDFACYFVLLVKKRGRKAEQLWAFPYLTVVLCDLLYYCGIIISILKHFEQYLINDCYSVEVIISIFFSLLSQVHATDNTRMELIIPGEQHFYMKAVNAAERQRWLVALGSAKACLADTRTKKEKGMYVT